MMSSVGVELFWFRAFGEWGFGMLGDAWLVFGSLHALRGGMECMSRDVEVSSCLGSELLGSGLLSS